MCSSDLLAATFNPSGVSLAVGAAQNNNTIDNTITVTIDDGAAPGSAAINRSALQAQRHLIAGASDTRSRMGDVQAIPVAAALGGVLALSGGGAGINSRVANTVTTSVGGAVDLSAGVAPAQFLQTSPQLATYPGLAQQTDLYSTGPLRIGDSVSFTLAQGTAQVPVSCSFTSLDPATQMQQLAEAIQAAAGPLQISAAVVSDGQGVEAAPMVQLSGAVGVGFTVSDLSLKGAKTTDGSLLLASGALAPDLVENLGTASNTAGDSLDAQIMEIGRAHV